MTDSPMARLDAECGMNPPNSAGYYYQKRTNQAVAECAASLQQPALREALADGCCCGHRGLVNMSVVDTALLRKWRTGLRLGLFQQPTPWDGLGKETIHSAEHVALTLSAAEQSMTLLKNANDTHGKPTLPLQEAKYRRIALIGPGLDLHGGDMQGPYSGQANVSSVLDALLARFGKDALQKRFVIQGGTGAGFGGGNSTAGIPAAVSAVRQTDVDLVLLFVCDQFVSEGADRTDTRLLHGQVRRTLSWPRTWANFSVL